MKIMPPNYLWPFIILGILLHCYFPIIKIITSPYNYLGILLICFGIYLNLEVWRYFKKVKNTMNPHGIPRMFLTYGVFKISRNPIYLGMALILLGEAILLGSLTPFVLPILFIVITDILVIPYEEKNLEKKFGKKYLEYKEKVRRWL